jgi:putative nucleotidyltransferase with HDIG domain
MFGMLLFLALGLWTYLLTYNPKIGRNPMRGLAITALLLLCQGAAVALTQAGPQYLFVSATMPTLVVATVLAIVYDQRMALAVGALHTLMVLIALDQSFGFAVVTLAGIGVAVSQLDAVRSRSKLLQVGGIASAVMALAALCVGLFERPLNLPGQYTFLGFDIAMAAVSGIATGLLVQGVLPIIESVFKVTTAMTLKELNDASHPLLQRLAQEAPGTYAHSLRIADMAQAAADAVGANGLLCRVGSMYHDIGKINKPSYFIENQAGGPNRHNRLSPAMSLLIIVGHVKDGIEMAREFGLPPILRGFIESHHGTTLVEYFYHAARKQQEAAAPGNSAPAEFDYRYPGPKPQSKETAIVLLCDTCESAIRALPDPTPIRIEQRVHELASKRLMDGQFDECNLTLAELSRIEASVVKTLNAMYHGRIRYPGGRGDRARDTTAPTPAPSTPTPAPTADDRALTGQFPQHQHAAS